MAIGDSIFPLLNAFLLLFMFTIVFAILATHLFRTRSPWFVNFEASLFTMFQVRCAHKALYMQRSLHTLYLQSALRTDNVHIYIHHDPGVPVVKMDADISVDAY